MSKIRFLHTPFPDNHDGFDYSPKSVSDVQRDDASVARAKLEQQNANKLLSMLASIFN